MIEVVEVGKSLDGFIRVPLELYEKDPFFVPQLTGEMKVHFSPKNPFFNFSEVQFFIVLKDGRRAGRIASFVNSRHNDFHKELTGFFGFFESIPDQQVADALFERAALFLREKGMERMRGPFNFSMNEECGFLFDGFHEPPVIMMPYNPPFYNDLSERYGLGKVKDLYAYIHEMQEELPAKVIRVADIAEKRGITARNINMQRFIEDMHIFKEVYHSAWEENWGFVPMTDEELEYSAKRLKQIVIPELTVIAEKDGVPVGFFGIVPDFNVVLKKMNGRLNPLTILKALYFSRKIHDSRALLLGIRKDYRNKGVEALMFRKAFGPLKKGRYRRVEFSWILEDNVAVQRTIETFGGKLYKRYRIYEKSL
jgi:GNAT superfamily N-acetyltransferase